MKRVGRLEALLVGHLSRGAQHLLDGFSAALLDLRKTFFSAP